MGATTVTCAPQRARLRARRAATDPPPTTRTGRPASARCTGKRVASGISGSPRRPRIAVHRGQRSVRRAVLGDQLGLATLLVEAEDLQLGCEVDLAQQRLVGHGDHRRREVEDRPDPGGEEAVGDVLGGRRRRGDDADGDLVLLGDLGQVIEMADGDPVDLLADLGRGRRRPAQRSESRAG